MTSKAEPIHRGTLVCVVLKAKNLPNKKSIGKQDPYCTLSLGTAVQKTKPDKRGGQHPTWDEQLHFEIYDDMEDQLKVGADAISSEANNANATIRPNRSKGGAKSLKVTCYADDAKDPEFIGDGVVDLTDTLKTGEFDEWVTIKAKDRYAGEVYLELTFYSSAIPPKKKKQPTPALNPSGTTYGGAGTFSEDIDDAEFAPRPMPKESVHAPIPSYMRPDSQSGIRSSQSTPRFPNTSTLSASRSQAQFDTMPTSESVPFSLRPSSSLAQLDTYTPPYAPPQIHREKSPAPSTFNELRRMSIPPVGHSPSAQIHAHRLSDAAPPAFPIQQQMHQQYNYSAHQQGIEELTGTLSSVSLISRPTLNEQPQQQSYRPEDSHSYVQSHNQHSHHSLSKPSIDQYGRPALAPSTQSYQAGSSFTPIPTPPPVSTSAPPEVTTFPTNPPPSWHQQGHPPLPSSYSLISSPYSIPPHTGPPPGMPQDLRPASPSVNSLPSRPHTAGSYHALPHPPLQAQSHQQQIEHRQINPNPSPLHSNRPLPPTANQAMPIPAPSQYSTGAPLGANYYPPPAQTPSHYISPPAMQWPHNQDMINRSNSSSNDAYLSYPPPPPGPSNGEYVHPSPQQASPSIHPGQYPPPPPIHQMEYPSHLQQHPYNNQSIHNTSMISNDPSVNSNALLPHPNTTSIPHSISHSYYHHSNAQSPQKQQQQQQQQQHHHHHHHHQPY